MDFNLNILNIIVRKGYIYNSISWDLNTPFKCAAHTGLSMVMASQFSGEWLNPIRALSYYV